MGKEVGVDVNMLIDSADYIFQSDNRGHHFDKELNLDEFMEIIMKLRGSNNATVRDIFQMRQFFHAQFTSESNELARLEERLKIGHEEREVLLQKLDRGHEENQELKDQITRFASEA